MAQQGGSGDDILLKLDVSGRENLKDARKDAQALQDTMNKGGKTDISQPTQTLRQQIRLAVVEAQNLAASGKQNTEEFRQAAKRVAELRDRQEDLNRTFKAFDPDNKFKVFVTAASAGAKIVQGYAGAMAFLGVKGKDAAETIAKLQGIMLFADAIGSLHDLKDSFKDLLSLLGLNTKAAQIAADAQAEFGSQSVAATEEQAAAETELQQLRENVAATSIAAEEAVTAAKAEGLDATIAMTDAEKVALDALAAQQVAVEQLTAAELALSDAQSVAAKTAGEQAAASTGLAVAEEGAEVASVGLGVALKAIGIGLIVSAVAYLIANFKAVKKAVEDLFPGLKTQGALFNEVKEIAFGLGNVLLQFVILPIKILIDVIKGDFKGAVEDFKKGIDVVSNFKAGEAYEAANIAAEAAKKRVALEIEANERIIKERKALGKDTAALEVATNKLKIQQLDKDKLTDEEYAKQKLDLESESTVALNAEWKKRHDKYVELLKADLDKIKDNEKENFKIVQEGSANQRDIELKDIDTKYNAELALLEKRKKANKNYNKDYSDLVAARGIETARVNKKYADAISDYNIEVNEAYLDTFDKNAITIKKKADELLKNATGSQKATILQDEEFLLARNEAIKNSTSNNTKSQTKLTSVEDKDRAKEGDTPTEAARKVTEIENAKLAAENASYDLQRIQLEGQYDALDKLTADHEKNKNDIEKEGADARKAIAQAEAEAKLKLYDAVGQGASAASDILGDSTIAGKALAVAAATISTYSAIAGQLAAFSAIPIPGYAIAQAIATGLVGLAQVKKILAVQVPAQSGAGGGAGGGQTAPVINTTVLQQSQNGSQQVTQAITNNNKQNQAPLKAYITTKDLKDQNAQSAYYQQQSTY